MTLLTLVIADLFPSKNTDLQTLSTQRLLSYRFLKKYHQQDALQENLCDWVWSKNKFDKHSLKNPVALLTAIGLDLCDNNNTSYWQRLDFVECISDFNQVIMLGNQTIDWSQEPLIKLHENLRNLANHYQIDYYACGHFALLKSREPIGFCAQAPNDFLGEAIHAYLPQDNQIKIWVNFINEAQMIIQQLKPVVANMGDEFKINSIWLSGQGELPLSKSNVSWDLIIANNAYVKGFAKFFNIEYREITDDFYDVVKKYKNVLLIDDGLTKFAYQNNQNWLQQSDMLIEKYIKPLPFEKFKKVKLFGGAGNVFIVSKWKRVMHALINKLSLR